MQIRFISKQAFHTILDAISPPSDLFLAITSVLCHYHFPGLLPEIFFICFSFTFSTLPKLQGRYVGQDSLSLKNCICYFIHFLHSLPLSIWDCWIKLPPSSVLVFLFQKLRSLAMSHLFHFFWKNFLPVSHFYADKMANWMD